ncbi:serine/threonine-protein kinase SMG1-like [Physella acuta]|uniref:serine/threonine-protein kinase SMG1-like n=1 Tax=Physella acuta TaxID=109671 RepID=UPI0027DAC890|nr:serine/threonine-protein kinase SMG1-like [Physella acuta]
MSEVLNVESVKSPDKDAKSNGTGNAGDGRDQNPPANRAVDRRGRGEGFYSSENRSKQSSMRNDISSRDERNHSYSGRDGYRTKEKPRRSSSRGNTKVSNLSNSTTASNNSINDSSTGSNGSISSYSNRVRRAEEMDRRGQNSINRPGRRTEEPLARSRIQGPPPPSNSSFDKKAGDGKDLNKGYVEDPLIKLMKRITRVGFERDRRITSARQLKDYLHGPEVKTTKTTKQIYDAIHCLQNVLFERSGKELKQEVAICIGMLGSFLGQEIPRFFEWVFSNVNSSETDVKVYVSLALLEMLKQDESQQRARDFMTGVMGNIQHMLESATVPSLLMVVMDIIIVIARVYPHVFSSCFREVSDIVIGWLIDPTQNIHLIDHMAAALVQLQPFWKSDIEFSVMLLGQFTEDLEIMLGQDLNQAIEGSSDSSVKTVAEKITALLRVFYTVVLSLGDSISTLRGGQITVGFLVQLLNKLLSGLGPAVKLGISENITIISNDSARLLLHQLSAEYAMTCGEIILPYIISQTTSPCVASNSVAVSMLRLLKKIVEIFSTQLPVSFLMDLLGPNSVLPAYRFSQCPQVLSELMSVYHCLLALKSVPLLEEAYRLVLSDTEVSYNILLTASQQKPLQLVNGENLFKNTSYSQRHAQQAIMFNIGALTEIANTKSNLIGMWALSPSIFTLMSCNLLLTDPWLNKHQAQVVYTVLHAFYSHCNRHANFMSSSQLLSPPSPMDIPRLATNQNFSEILRIIVTLLDSDSTSFDCRCLLMKWSSDIIAALSSSPHIFSAPALSGFVNSITMQGYHREQQILQCSAQCLKSIYKVTTALSDNVTKKCMELCVYRLSDTRKNVRESFLSLVKILPLDKIINMDLFEGEEEWMSSERRNKEVGLSASWHVRRAHMAHSPTGNFHSHNFRHVMAYILNGTQPSQNGSYHWLEAMFHVKQRNGKVKGPSDMSVCLTDIIDSNESLLWFWATWECAQFAILSRLRTPLGKAPETFMAIEGVIKAFAAESQNFSNLDDSLERRENIRGEKLGEYVCLHRVHLLMNFMEHLDKLLYNAYEGCSVAMPAVHKVVKTFFRTNRNTCQEWLSRIRMALLTIATHCGMWAMAVRQAFELLRDLEEFGSTQSPAFEQALVYLVQALCELNAPESIVGLYQLFKDTTGRSMTWILAAAEKANKRYEKAATEFQTSLTTLVSGESSEVSDDLDPLSSPQGSPRRKDNSKTGGKTAPAYLPTTVNFLANQVTDCYVKLNDWASIIEWQQKMSQQQWQLDGGSSSIKSTVDINYIKALSEFELGNLENMKQNLELVPGMNVSEANSQRSEGCGGPSSWDIRREEDQLHRMFIKASTQLMEPTDSLHRTDTVRCIQQAERLGDGLLKICAMDWPPALLPDCLTQLASLVALRKQLDERNIKTSLVPLSKNLDPGVEDDLSVYHQLMRTIHLQQRLSAHDKYHDLSGQLSSIHLAAATIARKQVNVATAEDILLRQATSILGTHPEDLITAMTSIRSMAKAGCTMQKEMLKMQREGAKLLRTIGKQRSSLDVLAGSVVASIWSIDDPSNWNQDQECAHLNAKSLLTLVKWLQADPKLLSSLTSQIPQVGVNNDSNPPSSLVKHLNTLLELETSAVKRGKASLVSTGTSIGESTVLPETEGVIGSLLHLSSIQSPILAKSWFTLAGWCYKWGRKAVDNASNGYVLLTEEEEAQVLKILPKSTSTEEKEKVLAVLSQIHNMESSEEDIIDEDQSMYDDGTETTRKQLLACSMSLSVAPDSCLDRLLSVWKGVVKRVYHYYQLSAKAYFTYLHVNGLSDKIDDKGGNIISTLRLLRLLVKHASELREVLETGLSQTPTSPWKGIIPQLFSRLSHPESYVRQSISELLCRIAQDAPHLIVYPAVVGSSSKIQIKLPVQKGFLKPFLSQDNGQDENELLPEVEDTLVDDDFVDESSSPELQACLSSIVETLSKLNPQMIGEVQLMVQELRRITLLWEELWLGTLNQHQADVHRRLAQLNAEIKRVEANKSLSKAMKITVIKEKHKTIMKPTLYTLEHLNEITSQPAQTPQEKAFQLAYGKQINAALQRLREPPDASNPQDNWSLFKLIHNSLQLRAQKRNSLQLKMDEISPKLSALKNSVIPMPGLTSAGQIITIEAVQNTAQILPTKTKPKKLIFIGSDGKKHPYLFKGLEDLHLDERIMQFLSTVNNMFSYHKRSNESRHLYRARHYSVTPLGPRSGLIQWVEGATALFSLYKKWQQREAVAQTLKSVNNVSSVPPPIPSIPRPSEVFFNKLTPALKEKGIDFVDNRKEWPLSVLRKVLDDLMDETPDDLLAKEIWCCSSGAGEWWQVTQSYARSTAVMSMIGYIIGLGDRHLDNVLVDLATGEVVHIDYNVCFEKGKGLRVPEKVPFRMTANIETALGLTGVEGTFRLASEHVMKTMRKGRESLLTLLEAFVYDPLVDWTTGGDAGYTGAFYGGELAQGGGAAGDTRQSKQQMERDITTSMFSIRLTEMDSAWTKNKSDMLSSLPVLAASIVEWMKTSDKLETAATSLEGLHTIQQVLLDAQSNPHHSLTTLSDRYSDYMVLKATQDQVMSSVVDKITELSNWHKVHMMSLDKLQSSSFQAMCAEVSSHLDLGTPSFSAASSFLQNAGQSQIITQCEQLESEMCSILEQRRALLHNVVKILHTYTTVVSQFGIAFSEDNRTFKFLGWLRELLSDFTSHKCDDVMAFHVEMYSPSPTSQVNKAQSIFAIEAKLQNLLTDTNAKLIKLRDRRAQESTDTNILGAQVQEADEAIKTFVRENGLEGERSLMSVIVSALYTLNKRYLLMEGAAAGAGDRLMDLTSRDGDWFLDELCSMSGNVNQFLETLNGYTKICEMTNVKNLQYSLRTTHNVYVALQDLNINFRSIILPETLKLTQAQDEHFISILSQLDALIHQSNSSLDVLVKQLELMHRNAIMGLEDEKPEVLMEIKRIQQDFMDLIQNGSSPASKLSSDQLTSAQMLLMGFNGLFTRLESDFAELLDSMETLEVTSVWKKVDTVREAKSLQLSNFSSTTRPLLAQLFFLKRLQAMQGFFLMTTQFAEALQGHSGGVVYDEEQMSKPIKRYIADFVRKQVLGFPSQVLGYIICVFLGGLGVNVTAEIELKDIGAELKMPLDLLCKKGMETCLNTGQFQHRHLTQVTALTSNLDTAWRKLDLAKRLDAHIILMKGQVQRCQPQLARFQWLHEDIFTQAGRQHSQMINPARAAVMSEMKKTAQALLSQESVLTSCQERYNQMEASISQRLRWAAGANPSLNVVLTNFEQSALYRKKFIEEENKRVTEAGNLCQGILHLEALRTQTIEASSSDTSFRQLLNKCSECCMMLESTCSSVTDLELSIINIQPLTDTEKSDLNWIKKAMDAVDNTVKDAKKKLEQIAISLEECQRNIKESVSVIKVHLSSHHKLMSDIRSILKTLAKLEEQDYGEEVQPGGIRDYLAHYKTFSEKITAILKTVVSDMTTRDEMSQSVADLEELRTQLDLIYDSLSEFAPSIMSTSMTLEQQNDPASGDVDNKKLLDPAVRAIIQTKERDSPPLQNLNSPINQSTGVKLQAKKEKVSRDPKTGKAVQERNSYAVGVWRRVKMKLEGRDPDPNKRMSIAEQVDYIIKEAKNLDNLAVLYEGWTPWV